MSSGGYGVGLQGTNKVNGSSAFTLETGKLLAGFRLGTDPLQGSQDGA